MYNIKENTYNPIMQERCKIVKQEIGQNIWDEIYDMQKKGDVADVK
jgi:hypothetical protein